MKQTKRNAILEAFASSKPYEFDGFVAQYLQRYPELEPVVVPILTAPAENESETVVADIPHFEMEVEAPKPKRKRTRKAAPIIETKSVMEVFNSEAETTEA